MKEKINKQQLVIEFISVVFAVILALILNSWRENYALNSDMEKVKESIHKEVVRNDSLIRKSHAYRGALLDKLYSNKNLLFTAPVAEFPVDVYDNEALAEFFRTNILFGQKMLYERVEVRQSDSARVLILDQGVFDLVIDSGTLQLLGLGNIQLKVPNVSNNGWTLAQATNTVVNMNVELVE